MQKRTLPGRRLACTIVAKTNPRYMLELYDQADATKYLKNTDWSDYFTSNCGPLHSCKIDKVGAGGSDPYPNEIIVSPSGQI